MRTDRARQLVAIVLGLALTGGILTGCSAFKPGAAAVVGGVRIPESELNNYVQAVLNAQGKAPDTADQPLTNAILSRLVIAQLVDVVSAEQGVTVSQGTLDSTIQGYVQSAGSEAKVSEILLKSNVPPSETESFVRTNIQAQELGKVLAPTADIQGQSDALVATLLATGTRIGVEVSPEYGSWNGSQLSIGPIIDDLSSPAAN